MRRRRRSQAAQPRSRRGESLAWDVAPLMVLAGAGVALLRESAPERPSARGREVERGRLAAAPAEIPKRGWKDILLRTRKEFSKDQIPLISAGVTFYALLALFPGVAAFVSLYGLFADVGEAQRHLAALEFLLPPTAVAFIGEQMVRLASASEGGLSLAFAAGLLTAIWSANGAVKALILGLNIAYEETERRGLVRRTIVSLGFTVGFLLFLMTTLGMFAARPAVEALMGPDAGRTFALLSWPVVILALIAGLALLYRYGPSRDPVQWKWISWGSVGVIIVWLAASALFSIYVNNFAHYDKTYGPLGAAIGLMMWVYVSTIVVLAGAELNAEIEHQTTLDTTVGAPQPMGLRRAKMADTVGAAQGA
jgi:membrane protein